MSTRLSRRPGRKGAATVLLAGLLAAAAARAEPPQPPQPPQPDNRTVLAGSWVFDAQPGFPGLRMVQFRRLGTGWSGTLTTAWYGPAQLTDIRQDDDVLRFSVGNGNPRLPPLFWSARRVGARIELRGRIWSTIVDGYGERGTPEQVLSHSFVSAPLPPMRILPPNGLAPTPPMGWSSWNRFADRIDDRTVRQVADALVSSGLRDAGYRYVNIDDGWQGDRGADGRIRPNARFPDMPALARYLHARGLAFGLYSSPGPKTCAGYTGSYGHVAQDAQTYAAWGVDYLKYDLCSGEAFFRTRDEIERAYDEMGQALRATGRPILFSLCEYGRDAVGEWGRDVGGSLWRTTGDIENSYRSMAANGFDHDGDPADSGPGGWNDPDMLEIGNGGLGPDAERSHLSLWALDAAPLLLGNDPRSMSEQTRVLLTNRAVLAVDQDPLGIGGQRVRTDGAVELWRKPLAGGDVALGLFNRGAVPVSVRFVDADVGPTGIARALDLWRGVPLARGLRSVTLPAEGAMLLRVTLGQSAH